VTLQIVELVVEAVPQLAIQCFLLLETLAGERDFLQYASIFVSALSISLIASGMEFGMRARFNQMTYDYYAYSPPWCGWRLDRSLAARCLRLLLTQESVHLHRRYTKRGVISTLCLATFLTSNVIYRVLSIATCARALGASAGALVGATLVVDHIIFQFVRRQDDAHIYAMVGVPAWLFHIGFWMAMQFFPVPWIRDPCFIGAQNYAIWIILGLLESTFFLVVSFIVGGVETTLFIIGGTCCTATIISIVAGLAVIDHKFRRFFWLRELVRDNQLRDWSVGHAQSVAERDLVRSMLFTAAYVGKDIPQYFDPVVVNDWLKKGWSRWQVSKPEWCTPDWMASANAHLDGIAIGHDLPKSSAIASVQVV
jgi:hypothetical protein